MKRQLSVHGPGGSSDGALNVTHSSSSLKVTVHEMVVPSEARTSKSLTASSAALSTISRIGSWMMASMASVPEKVAKAMSGSISMR